MSNHFLNQLEMSSNNNIVSIDEFDNIIEFIKLIIQDGRLLRNSEHTLINDLNSIIDCKDISNDYRNKYDEFITFLEIYDAQYNNKYNDLITYILNNLKDDQKQLLSRDNDGIPILLARPMLERSYNNINNNNLLNENAYNLILSIKVSMRNIYEFENHYLQNEITGNTNTNTNTNTNH
jgi:hypothetical protein